MTTILPASNFIRVDPPRQELDFILSNFKDAGHEILSNDSCMKYDDETEDGWPNLPGSQPIDLKSITDDFFELYEAIALESQSFEGDFARFSNSKFVTPRWDTLNEFLHFSASKEEVCEVDPFHNRYIKYVTDLLLAKQRVISGLRWLLSEGQFIAEYEKSNGELHPIHSWFWLSHEGYHTIENRAYCSGSVNSQVYVRRPETTNKSNKELVSRGPKFSELHEPCRVAALSFITEEEMSQTQLMQNLRVKFRIKDKPSEGTICRWIKGWREIVEHENYIS